MIIRNGGPKRKQTKQQKTFQPNDEFALLIYGYEDKQTRIKVVYEGATQTVLGI